MKSGIRIFFMIALLCVPSAYAQDANAPPAPPKKIEAPKVFNAFTATLENGMEVVVIPNHRAPVVTHMVWYKAGAADELPGKSGAAHFLEHLMFKGSESLAPGEFSKKIRALGGNDNAFTSHDYTAYFQSIAAEHLEAVMRMEAGRMRTINAPVSEVDSERKVILEERRQRTDNNPGARFAEQVNAVLFINHPYAKPVIGWAHEMEGLTWEDTKSFHDKWYHPNNAILVVSGDVTGPQVLDLAKKIYGPIPRGEVPVRIRPGVPRLDGATQVRFKDKTVREPMVQMSFRVPGARRVPAESRALQVLAEILGGGPSARLYQSLVVDQKIATDAGVSYNPQSWDDTDFTLYAVPAPDKKPDDIRKALRAELLKIAGSGVTAAELSDAIASMQNEAIYARDSLTGPAMIMGYSLASGMTIDDVEHWPSRIAAVKIPDIMGVTLAYLDPDNDRVQPVVGFLMPAGSGKTKDTPSSKAAAATSSPQPSQAGGVQ